jgi:hypothetical protein
MIASDPIRAGAVVSYSHKDAKHAERLRIHLSPFVRDKKVDYWIDNMIKPGSTWRDEIKQSFDCAKVAIVLVSANFLASEFIMENELPPLLIKAEQSKVIILSVLLSPCAFKHSPLFKYQAINSASKPLSGMGWHGRETVWADLAERVNDALNR